MSFDSYRAYYEFARQVRKERRSERRDSDQKFLEAVLTTSHEKGRHKIVEKGKAVWRAQAAFSWNDIPVGPDDWEKVPDCCPTDRLIPQAEFLGKNGEKRLISAGRANREGETIFYCAKDPETAMTETRPWRGRLITVGVFEICRQLRVVDFSGASFEPLSYMYLDDGPLVREADVTDYVWGCLDDAFRQPLTSDDEPADYFPTQILASFLRDNGIDGIAYDSAAAKGGLNLALFDLEALEFRQKKLYSAEEVNPEYKDQSWC